MDKYTRIYMKLLFAVIFISAFNKSNAFDGSFISHELVGSFEGYELANAFNKIDPIGSTIANTPNCYVEVYKIRYFTTGSQAEIITSTAAVMLPKGEDRLCRSQHPALLHAHGTAGSQLYDFSKVANIENPAAYRSTSLALNFASQGYIVIAPNYAGYSESSLSYHPYLNSEQQANEMYDAYEAAKQMLVLLNISMSDKLFISGYSQGGHVALATSKLFKHKGEKVTAISPMSGPYALLAFGDYVFKGNVSLGSNFFIPLLTLDYQKAYGEDFINVHDIFQESFLKLIESDSSTHWSNKLMSLPNGVFEPIVLNENLKFGFDNNDYLVKTNFRRNYLNDIINNPDLDKKLSVNPVNKLRQALKKNDLRTYVPDEPVLLCGGNQDPVVYYDVNTTALYEAWKTERVDRSKTLDVTVLDVDTSNSTLRNQKPLILLGKAKVNDRNMGKVSEKVYSNFLAMLEKEQDDSKNLQYIYHSSLVAPNCINAAKSFFDSFLTNYANNRPDY